jgi:hypothetical protein
MRPHLWEDAYCRAANSGGTEIPVLEVRCARCGLVVDKREIYSISPYVFVMKIGRYVASDCDEVVLRDVLDS